MLYVHPAITSLSLSLSLFLCVYINHIIISSRDIVELVQPKLQGSSRYIAVTYCRHTPVWSVSTFSQSLSVHIHVVRITCSLLHS